MKTEISRDSHQPDKRYSGVYQQQGRMLTDADWNELVDILKHRLDDALKDVVGNGSPIHRGVVSNETDPPKLQWGYVHIDGVQAIVRPDQGATSATDFEYGHQEDFPSPPATDSAIDYVLYADVWERTVTHLMDQGLRDKALHGADTSTRKQTMAQIKWCPDDVEPEQSARNPAKGNARLDVTLLQKTTQPDPCDPCAAELDVESRIGNYLFRVEVHDVEGDANNASRVTLKWSSENAAEHYALKSATGDDVEPPAAFKSGQWVYEFFDETSERHLGVHLAPGFTPSREDLTEGYPAAVPARNFVRRWDGYCVLEKDGGNWVIAEDSEAEPLGVDRGAALQHTDSGALGFVGIETNEDGLLRFTAKLANTELNLTLQKKEGSDPAEDCSFVAGDFWLAEVREAEHQAGDPLLTRAAPHGIEHHYLALGKVIGGVLQLNPEADRKYAFPPLTEMTRLFHVGGDGQEAMPGHFVPQSLKVGVTNGEWPVAGAKVEFSITKGNGKLEAHPDFALENFDTGNPVTGIATTAGGSRSGTAQCRWQLGTVGSTPEDRKQRVTARLVHPDSLPGDADYPRYLDHPPIHFYANLSTADQVAYDNPVCTDTPSVNSLLEADLGGSWPDFDGDGDSTVKDALDVLLCKLRARHIPYDPTNLSRWNDVNQEEGVTAPDTVQKAIDALLENLHSEDISYPLPDCSPATNTVKVYLQPHIAHDSADGPDRFRIKALWDALLCHLDAAKLPYNPNQSSEVTSRWRDIKEQPGTGDLAEPNTVQEAIDDLLRLLESTDISYEVPNCGTAATPTVRSGLGISAGTHKIDEILDKLLCEFKATDLPMDRGADLCDKLKADAQVKTVQDAINLVCRTQGGGGCAVTVGEGGNYPDLPSAFASEEISSESEIAICLLPGIHFIDKLDVSSKKSISITGRNSEVHVQGPVLLEAKNIKLSGVQFLVIDKGSADYQGTGHLILAASGGANVFVENCQFFRFFPGKATQWRPLVTVAKRSNLKWSANSMIAIRLREEILSAAIPKREDIPGAGLEAYDGLVKVLKPNPYQDSVLFDSNVKSVAEKIAALDGATRDEWYAKRSVNLIEALPAERVRVGLPLAGRERVEVVSGSGVVQPRPRAVSPAPTAGSTATSGRRSVMTELSPRNEVEALFELVRTGDAANVDAIADKIRDIAALVPEPDYALALESNLAWGWITNNDISGYVALHHDQNGGTRLRWPSTLNAPWAANKKIWVTGTLASDLSPRKQLDLQGNVVTAVHSMISGENDKAIQAILSDGASPGISIQAYQSLTVRDNIFSEGENGFIAEFLNMSGNQFPDVTGDNAIVAYTLGFSGIFVGNQSRNSAQLEAILVRRDQAANFLTFV